MPEDITIVVDTREQQPYTFGEIETIKAALPAGDYSLAGHELEISVERKSLNDFVSTVIHNRDRFKKELKKLVWYKHACITVEATAEDIRNRRYTGNAHPESIIGSVMAVTIIWGIPVFLNGNRQESLEFTRRYLIKAGDNLTRQAAKEEANCEAGEKGNQLNDKAAVNKNQEKSCAKGTGKSKTKKKKRTVEA